MHFSRLQTVWKDLSSPPCRWWAHAKTPFRQQLPLSCRFPPVFLSASPGPLSLLHASTAESPVQWTLLELIICSSSVEVVFWVLNFILICLSNFFRCLRTMLKASKGMPPHFPQKLNSRELRSNCLFSEDLPKETWPAREQTPLPSLKTPDNDNTRLASASTVTYMTSKAVLLSPTKSVAMLWNLFSLKETVSRLVQTLFPHFGRATYIVAGFNFFKLTVLW